MDPDLDPDPLVGGTDPDPNTIFHSKLLFFGPENLGLQQVTRGLRSNKNPGSEKLVDGKN